MGRRERSVALRDLFLGDCKTFNFDGTVHIGTCPIHHNNSMFVVV